MNDRPIGYRMHRLMLTNWKYWYYLKRISVFKSGRVRPIFVYFAKEFEEELEDSGICEDGPRMLSYESFYSVEAKINGHTFDFRFSNSISGGLDLTIVRIRWKINFERGPTLTIKDYKVDFDKILKLAMNWKNWERGIV
jgi:hypothetical protein